MYLILKRTKLKVIISCGKNGMWRWFAYRDNELIARDGKTSRGFALPADAVRAVRSVLKGYKFTFEYKEYVAKPKKSEQPE